jgi:hypothetical protein
MLHDLHQSSITRINAVIGCVYYIRTFEFAQAFMQSEIDCSPPALSKLALEAILAINHIGALEQPFERIAIRWTAAAVIVKTKHTLRAHFH